MYLSYFLVFLIAEDLVFQVKLVGLVKLVLAFHFFDESLEGRTALTLGRIRLILALGEEWFFLRKVFEVVSLFAKL